MYIIRNAMVLMRGLYHHIKFLWIYNSEIRSLKIVVDSLKVDTQFDVVIYVLASRIYVHARCIRSLICYGYYLEALSILRSIMESILYIEYFYCRPDQADKWRKEEIGTISIGRDVMPVIKLDAKVSIHI